MDGLPVDQVTTFTVDPTNPKVLYLGMDSGLFKSNDGAAHWETIENGLSPQNLFPISILVDPSSSQTLYLGTFEKGIYKSTDGGANWAAAGASSTALR